MNKPKVTINSVAQRAGVSIATVSRVVNGSKDVSPALKSRIEQVMAEMEYTPRRKNGGEEVFKGDKGGLHRERLFR